MKHGVSGSKTWGVFTSAGRGKTIEFMGMRREQNKRPFCEKIPPGAKIFLPAGP